MVLRRTLPSRVMVDDSPATPIAQNAASQTPAVTQSSTEDRAREQAREATEAADAASRAAALAADLDDLPVGGQGQRLEENFAAMPSAPVTAPTPATPVNPLDIAKGIEAFQRREVTDSFTPKAANVTAGADPFSPAAAPASSQPNAVSATEGFKLHPGELAGSFTMKTADITNAADPFNPGVTPVKVPNPFEAPAPVAAPVEIPAEAVIESVAVTPKAEPVAEVRTEVPAAAQDMTPSRPAQNNMKRRVREKTPRNFSFTPSAEVPATPAAPDLLPPAPAVAAYEARVEDDTLSGPVAMGTPQESSLLPPISEPAPVQTFAVSEPAKPSQPAPLEEGGVSGEPASVAVPSQPVAAPVIPSVAAPVLAPMGSLSNAAPVADVAPLAPASDLPWVNNADGQTDDWQVETPATSATTNPYAAQEGPAPLDIYGGLGGNAVPSAPAGIPAYLSANNGNGPAPELPKATNKSHRAAPGGSNGLQWAAGLVVVAVVGVGAFSLVQSDKSQERVARLTGALTETTEKLPPELGGAQTTPNANVLAPEQVIAMGDVNNTGILPPPPATSAENGTSTFQPLTPATPSSSAMIDFADVPASEASQKIVGDNAAKMPDDIGLIAKFQQAVTDEKARQNGTTPPVSATPAQVAALPASQEPAQSPGLTPAEKEAQNLALQSKLEGELAAYRETLASSETPAAAPKPSDFFKNPESFVNGTAAANAKNAAAGASSTPLQPPVATTAEQAAQLAPNPNNLPLLPEPTAAQEPQVRQLSDFNVDAFEAQDDRVRIPKGIRPRFASTDFPEVEVLSFVPGRGVIAFNRGREGVLLIGESLEGWELMSVSVDKAEFKNGRSVQYVSAE